jgi:acetyltransferase-like isoleucine patch superfamily enzyme
VVKNIILIIIKKINRLFYPKFDNKAHHSELLLFKLGIIQKVFRFNSSILWPVHKSSVFLSAEKIIPGTRTPGMAKNCFFDARNGIEIGENTWIAHGVNIISQNHNNNRYEKYIVSEPVVIGKNCLIGANVIILAEVVIGDHTLVAAGSVVTKSFKCKNKILAGNPAKIVKELKEYECAE